jgi:hypothetical protein
MSLEIEEYFKNDLTDIKIKTEESKYIGCDINNKIIPDHNIVSSKHIVLYSDMGKGKTVYIKRILNLANDKSPNILFISSRQSFANFICDSFQDINIKNYLDFADKNSYIGCNRLVVQLESLHKIDTSIHYDYIVLDEIESILKQFSSTTLHTCGITYQILEELITNAKKIIYSDAFISNRTLDFIREMRKLIINSKQVIYSDSYIPIKILKFIKEMKAETEQIYMIHNTKPAITKDAYQIESNKHDEFVLDLLKQDKNLFLPSSSRKKIMDLEVKILRAHQGKQSIFYYSGNDETITNTLKDVNTNWKNKNVIGCTSCITVGVSYDAPKHIDHVVLDARCNTGPCCRDILQMIRRVRHTSGDMYFALPHHNIVDSNSKYLYKIMKNMDRETNDKIRALKASLTSEKIDNPTIETCIQRLQHGMPNGLKIIILGNLRENIMSQLHFKPLLLKMLSMVGYTIHTIDDIKKQTKKTKKATNDYLNDYDDIQDIDKKEIEDIMLKHKMKSKRVMQLRLDKFFFSRDMLPSIDNNLKAKLFFQIYQNSYKKHIIHNLQAEKSDMSYMELTEHELFLAQDIATNFKMVAEKRKIIQEMSHILGLQNSQDIEKVITKDEINTCVQYLKDNLQTIGTVYNTCIKDVNNQTSFQTLLKSIYMDWSNCVITGTKKARGNKTIEFMLKGDSYIEHINIPYNLRSKKIYDVFEENI